MKTTHAHKTVASIFCLLVWHFVMEVKDLDIPLIPTTSSPNSPLSLYVDCFAPEVFSSVIILCGVLMACWDDWLLMYPPRAKQLSVAFPSFVWDD